MAEELNKIDARQGDRRKLSMRVLIFSLLVIGVIGLIAMYVI